MADRLGEEFHRSGFHGAHRHRHIRMTADEDDGQPYVGAHEVVLKIQAHFSRAASRQEPCSPAGRARHWVMNS